MNIKPIDNLLKSHFSRIFDAAHVKAKEDFNINIENRISDLSILNQWNFLHEETIRLEKIIKEHKHTYYIKNSNSEDWLLSQFASRTFLLNIDESEELFDAIYTGEYRHLISEAKQTIKKGIPQYSYEKYMNGEECEYFSLFNYIQNTTKEDYYKIKDYQAECLYKIVNHDFKKMTLLIQEYCKSLKDPLEFIKSENDKIDKLFEISDYSKGLKGELASLFISRYFNIGIYDEIKLIESFKHVAKETFNWGLITPNTINEALNKIDNGSDEFVSNEHTIFFTINKIKEWFEDIISGLSVNEKIEDTEWNRIIKEALTTADDKISEIIAEIEDFAYNENESKENIEKYLSEHIELYRKRYNRIEFKYYFHFFSEEHEHLLNRFIITNSYFGNDITEQIEILIESKIVYEVSWNLVQIYYEIFNKKNIGEHASSAEVYFILHKMVLDKELYEEFELYSNQFFSDFSSYNMPINFYFKNHTESISNLFNKVIGKLEDILNNAETTNKVIYIQSRLKELKQRELKLSQFKKEEGFDKKDYSYSKLLKDFLKIESEFINETKLITDLKIFKNINQKLLPVSSNILVDIIPEDKIKFILQLLEDLGITVDGKYILGEKKKSAIRGVVEALRKKNLIPNIGLEKINNIIAERINLDLKSKLDVSDTSKLYKKLTLEILENNNVL